MRRWALLLGSLLLAGCVTNGYKEFYTELPAAQDILTHRAAPAPAEPKVDHLAGRFDDYSSQYARAGYVPIGYSSYNGPDGADSGALEQAKALGADVVVILSPQYTETRTASIPITTPTTQTSHTNSTATVYGSGGSATGSGTATTTTYGTQTNYIPVSTRRYDFQAVYLVKRKYSFGAQFEPLTDEERASIQSNKGVRIAAVVNDTPAFEADVLVGDIVVSANGRSISRPEVFSDIISASAGQTIELVLIRNGQTFKKSVQLRP